jgi:hypothetical protein
MTWERYDRKGAGGSWRPSQFMEWVCIFGGGIRFSKLAKERWLGERPYVEIYVDPNTNSIGFKSVSEPTMNSFKVSASGDVKNGRPNFVVTCRSAVQWWSRGFKGRRHCTLIETPHNGIVQIIPEPMAEPCPICHVSDGCQHSLKVSAASN